MIKSGQRTEGKNVSWIRRKPWSPSRSRRWSGKPSRSGFLKILNGGRNSAGLTMNCSTASVPVSMTGAISGFQAWTRRSPWCSTRRMRWPTSCTEGTPCLPTVWVQGKLLRWWRRAWRAGGLGFPTKTFMWCQTT